MKTKKDIEIQWEANVQEAKKLADKIKGHQMIVAKLALEVCEITWGGHASVGKYTLTRFASETGYRLKLLSTWCAVYRNTYSKLPLEETRLSKYTELLETSFKVKPDASEGEVLEVLNQVKRTRGESANVLRILTTKFRQALYNFEFKNAAETADQKILEELVFYMNRIMANIKKSGRNIKGIDHGISRSVSLRNYISVNRALKGVRPSIGEKFKARVKDKDGHIILISDKDRMIINYLKQNRKYFGPTEIGMKVGKMNENNASAWAYRTLNKLIRTGNIQRNNRGHYRWVE